MLFHPQFVLDDTDSTPMSYRSVARRKTDLMPTIPSPRESSFGSRSSLYCHTPRTPGKHLQHIHNTLSHIKQQWYLIAIENITIILNMERWIRNSKTFFDRSRRLTDINCTYICHNYIQKKTSKYCFEKLSDIINCH